MKLLRVAAATLNQTPLDWDGNRTRIIAAIEAALSARRRGDAGNSGARPVFPTGTRRGPIIARPNA